MKSLELFCYDILELIALHGGPEVFALLRRVSKHFADETRDPELLIKYKNYYTETINQFKVFDYEMMYDDIYTITLLCGKLHSKINSNGESLPAVVDNQSDDCYWYKHGVPWRENNKPDVELEQYDTKCWRNANGGYVRCDHHNYANEGRYVQKYYQKGNSYITTEFIGERMIRVVTFIHKYLDRYAQRVPVDYIRNDSIRKLFMEKHYSKFYLHSILYEEVYDSKKLVLMNYYNRLGVVIVNGHIKRKNGNDEFVYKYNLE